MTPNGSTRVFAVLGDPVAHSLSPRMHNAGFQAMGLDAVYVAMQPAADEVLSVMATLARAGGGGNVTIPFKPVAAAASVHRTRVVERLGVANVFGRSASGDVFVDNTDVDGVIGALAKLGVGVTAIGVLGTGGSARAVAGAAERLGVSLAVRSRDTARAEAFAAWAEAVGAPRTAWSDCDMIINATPLGLRPGDPLPIAADILPERAAILDLVYQPMGTTAWVAACRAGGRPAADGRAVLLAQGAASWAHWFPKITPPLEVMQAALDGHLG